MQEYPWIVAFWMPALGIYWITTKIVKHLFRGPVEVPVKRDASGFRTHEEYLEARRSMNLGDFLDRAYATPEKVKREARNEAYLQTGGAGSDGADGIGFMASSVGGVRQGGGSASSLSDLLGHQQQLSLLKAVRLDATTSMGTFASPRPHSTKWCRRKADGALLMAVSIGPSKGSLCHLIDVMGNDIYQFLGDLEVATPKAGEWWIWNACDRHSWIQPVGPIIMHRDVPNTEGNVSCGCLAPVNYGKG